MHIQYQIQCNSMQSMLCNAYTISNTMQLYAINVMQCTYHIPSYAILYNINYHLNLYNVIQCYALFCNKNIIYHNRNTPCYATPKIHYHMQSHIASLSF